MAFLLHGSCLWDLDTQSHLFQIPSCVLGARRQEATFFTLSLLEFGIQLRFCQYDAGGEEDGGHVPAAIAFGKQVPIDVSVPMSSHQLHAYWQPGYQQV